MGNEKLYPGSCCAGFYEGQRDFCKHFEAAQGRPDEDAPGRRRRIRSRNGGEHPGPGKCTSSRRKRWSAPARKEFARVSTRGFWRSGGVALAGHRGYCGAYWRAAGLYRSAHERRAGEGSSLEPGSQGSFGACWRIATPRPPISWSGLSNRPREHLGRKPSSVSRSPSPITTSTRRGMLDRAIEAAMKQAMQLQWGRQVARLFPVAPPCSGGRRLRLDRSHRACRTRGSACGRDRRDHRGDQRLDLLQHAARKAPMNSPA